MASRDSGLTRSGLDFNGPPSITYRAQNKSSQQSPSTACMGWTSRQPSRGRSSAGEVTVHLILYTDFHLLSESSLARSVLQAKRGIARAGTRRTGASECNSCTCSFSDLRGAFHLCTVRLEPLDSLELFPTNTRIIDA